MTDKNRRLLTVSEIAEVLAVPESWVYARTAPSASDQIPFVRVGRYVRFSLRDVLCWLHARNER